MAESRNIRGNRAMPELPEDITTDILTRLPVRSLLRFRCVSKHFLTLIDGRDFIKPHLNRSLLTKTNHKLILQHLCTLPTRIYSVDLYKLDQTLELDHPFNSEHFNPQIIGSSDGLICACYGRKHVVIWNFATRSYRKVPVCDIKFPDYECFSPDINYGFGYDLVSDSYKLLRLVRFYGTDGNSTNTEAKVYSLRSNSWQRNQDFPYHLCDGESHGQLACGALHWLVTHNNGSDMTSSIAAFVLATNKYKLVDHPEFQDDDVFNVTKLEGRLSMVCSKSFGRTDVWVMKDYGVKESWIKLFSISKPEVIHNFKIVDPVAYSKSGTEIILVQGSKKLLWYSLKEGKVRTIPLRGCPYIFQPEICVESLVPLSGKADDYAMKKGGKDAKEQISGVKKRDHGLISGVQVEALGKGTDK